jgi:hypothetical protein
MQEIVRAAGIQSVRGSEPQVSLRADDKTAWIDMESVRDLTNNTVIKEMNAWV